MKGFEGLPPERNLEKDKQSFETAVAAASIEEIDAVFEDEAIGALSENIAKTKLFMLGEIHGVEENTDVIYTLFKKFGFKQLALEWGPELKEVAEKFAELGELDFDAIKDSPDGRIAPGHFALIKKLKNEGLLDKLICFDVYGGNWDERDVNMAKSILTNVADNPTLVVTGNLHAKTKPVRFDNGPDEHHPMGEHVKAAMPDISTGAIEYAKGQFYNYGVKDFENTDDEHPTSPGRFYRSNDGVYHFEIPEAHAAVVPNPHQKI